MFMLTSQLYLYVITKLNLIGAFYQDFRVFLPGRFMFVLLILPLNCPIREARLIIHVGFCICENVFSDCYYEQ